MRVFVVVVVVVDTTSGSAKKLLVSKYSQTPTDGHLFTMGTSLQWPLISVLADSSYNASSLSLSIMATSWQKQWPLKRVPNYQFFQRLMKKSRMVMKFDLYGSLMISAAIIFWLCSFYTATVSINCLLYLWRMWKVWAQ